MTRHRPVHLSGPADDPPDFRLARTPPPSVAGGPSANPAGPLRPPPRLWRPFPRLDTSLGPVNIDCPVRANAAIARARKACGSWEYRMAGPSSHPAPPKEPAPANARYTTRLPPAPTHNPRMPAAEGLTAQLIRCHRVRLSDRRVSRQIDLSAPGTPPSWGTPRYRPRIHCWQSPPCAGLMTGLNALAEFVDIELRSSSVDAHAGPRRSEPSAMRKNQVDPVSTDGIRPSRHGNRS